MPLYKANEHTIKIMDQIRAVSIVVVNIFSKTAVNLLQETVGYRFMPIHWNRSNLYFLSIFAPISHSAWIRPPMFVHK